MGDDSHEPKTIKAQQDITYFQHNNFIFKAEDLKVWGFFTHP